MRTFSEPLNLYVFAVIVTVSFCSISMFGETFVILTECVTFIGYGTEILLKLNVSFTSPVVLGHLYRAYTFLFLQDLLSRCYG